MRAQYNQRVYEEAADLLAVCASTPGVLLTAARPTLGVSSSALQIALRALTWVVYDARGALLDNVYAEAEARIRAGEYQ